MKVVPYFINMFDTIRHGTRFDDFIPEKNWLIPKNHSILSWTFDPDFFTRYKDHHNGDFRDWLNRDCELVKKYIRPCTAHPNITGHKAIADLIVSKLKDRGHFQK